LNLGTGAVSLGTAGARLFVTISANTLTVGGVISDGTTANSLTKGRAAIRSKRLNIIPARRQLTAEVESVNGSPLGSSQRGTAAPPSVVRRGIPPESLAAP